MGNVFTYYQTSKTFEITTQCAEGIYSFTLTNQNLQTTDITTHTGFNVQQTDATGGKYNLTFSRADGSANLFDNKLVFTIKTLQSLQSDVLIYWTTNTANNTYPYTGPYNITPTSYVGGSGAGDPHIMPYFNPKKIIYMLPTNNKIYKYFDNLCESERLVLNVKMWVLSNDFIGHVEKLQKNNDPLYFTESLKIVEKITDYNINFNDTSFARYASFIFCGQILTFDMETLNLVDLYGKNCHYDNYDLPELSLSSVPINNKIIISDILDTTPLKKMNLTQFGSKKRYVCFDTIKHGLIKFILYREHDRPNHRNQIDIIFDNNKLIKENNCCGVLINIKSSETVPGLDHINVTTNSFYNEFECETLESHKLKIKKFKKNKNNFVLRSH